MNEKQSLELRLKLDELMTMWHGFCQLHTQLFEYTCDEYMHLLASEIDSLDETVQKKLRLLEDISTMENSRAQLTSEIMALYQIENNPPKLATLLSTLKENNQTEVARQVEGMNAILLDIIEKIQEQNKKNQVFLNKAIHSLQELRESFAGKTNYKTYSAMGTTRSNGTL